FAHTVTIIDGNTSTALYALTASDACTIMYDDGGHSGVSGWLLVASAAKTRRAVFTTSGTWTAPAGVARGRLPGGGGGWWRRGLRKRRKHHRPWRSLRWRRWRGRRKIDHRRSRRGAGHELHGGRGRRWPRGRRRLEHGGPQRRRRHEQLGHDGRRSALASV